MHASSVGGSDYQGREPLRGWSRGRRDLRSRRRSHGGSSKNHASEQGQNRNDSASGRWRDNARRRWVALQNSGGGHADEESDRPTYQRRRQTARRAGEASG